MSSYIDEFVFLLGLFVFQTKFRLNKKLYVKKIKLKRYFLFFTDKSIDDLKKNRSVKSLIL